MAESFASPDEAAHHFAAALQDSAACIASEQFSYPYAQPLDVTRTAVLARGEDVPIGSGLHFYAAHSYSVTAEDDGSYAVRTGAYYYSISSDETGGEVGAWHWHPDSKSWCVWPHLHTHSALGKHAPTSRIAIEQVVRFMIRDMGVSPLRSDWEEVLEMHEADWRVRRSWA